MKGKKNNKWNSGLADLIQKLLVVMKRSNFFIGVAQWKRVIFGLCPRLFAVKRLSRNGVFCGMKGNGLNGLWKMDYPLEAEFKADLASKMEMRMEFGRFPTFKVMSGQVEWTSESLESGPRLFVVKLFSRNGVFYGMQGNVLSGLGKGLSS